MNNFSIHKGETKKEKITVYHMVNGKKEEYELGQGQSYRFEMKAQPCSSTVLLTKNFVNNEIEFVNADTSSLSCGKYFYVVKLIYPNNEFTIVIKNELIIE